MDFLLQPPIMVSIWQSAGERTEAAAERRSRLMAELQIIQSYFCLMLSGDLSPQNWIVFDWSFPR
jgi:hypothetical protein